MMGERRVNQAALFYTFSLEDHVPANHLLRSIDRFVELEGLRAHLAPFYGAMGRPSIDPELLIRMLLVGYCVGIRSDDAEADLYRYPGAPAALPPGQTAVSPRQPADFFNGIGRTRPSKPCPQSSRGRASSASMIGTPSRIG